MKTSELTGTLLDYWVARAEGLGPDPFDNGVEKWFGIYDDAAPGGIWWIGGPDLLSEDFYYSPSMRQYAPSSDWKDAGPLVEKNKLSVTECNGVWFVGSGGRFMNTGKTPLQAICRAIVLDSFGEEVDDV